MKGTAGILVAVTALLAGIMVFVFVEFRGGGDEGGGVRVGGVRKAEAACSEAAPQCLPRMTLLDTDGTAWTPEALAGKVVVVNVWATWCKPCVTEIPDLVQVYEAYREKGVVMLGVLDDNADDATAISFAAERGVNYPIVRMDDDLFKALGRPSKLPTTFVYDRSGHLHHGESGMVTRAELSSMIDELLAQ